VNENAAMKLLRKLRELLRKEKLDAEMAEEMRVYLFQIDDRPKMRGSFCFTSDWPGFEKKTATLSALSGYGVKAAAFVRRLRFFFTPLFNPQGLAGI
jgi:hypothetical protein